MKFIELWQTKEKEIYKKGKKNKFLNSDISLEIYIYWMNISSIIYHYYEIYWIIQKRNMKVKERNKLTNRKEGEWSERKKEANTPHTRTNPGRRHGCRHVGVIIIILLT